MATFFLLAISVIAVILLCKIAVFLYDDYIVRKKLSHIPGLTSLPLIGTLAWNVLLQTEEGKGDELESRTRSTIISTHSAYM